MVENGATGFEFLFFIQVIIVAIGKFIIIRQLFIIMQSALNIFKGIIRKISGEFIRLGYGVIIGICFHFEFYILPKTHGHVPLSHFFHSFLLECPEGLEGVKPLPWR